MAHAQKLRKALNNAQLALLALKERAPAVIVEASTEGMYLEFDGFPLHELKLESLEARRSGIELLSVSRDDENVEHATVFVPENKLAHFLRRIAAYENEKTDSGARKNAPMIEAVSDLRLATLRALWTDEQPRYPKKNTGVWWELWLRRDDGHEFERITAFAKAAKMTVEQSRLTFADRTVVAIFGTEEQLSSSLTVLGDIAEVRRAIRPSGFERLPPKEQREWSESLLQRLKRAATNSPSVCILDTGITAEHPLISGSLPSADLHAYNPAWGKGDDGGHGTEMAGLALFGDLDAAMSGSGPIRLRHALESVKILPPQGRNPPHLYGAVMAESVARVETTAPKRLRVFSMSVASDEEKHRRGQPTSWSAAVDALSAGRSFDPVEGGLEYLDDAGERRLFVVCAGNVHSTDIAHLDRSDTEPIHDPGQSWNALTINTTDGVIATLRGQSLSGKSVGVQLYSESNPPLMDFLATAGANAWPVQPYIYAPAADSERVADLIVRMAGGKVDAIVFTSSPQIDRMVEVAAERKIEDRWKQGLDRVKIASVGPVVSETLQRLGARVDIQPEQGFQMKNLVVHIRRALGPA